MSTHSMTFPSERSERMVYERVKAGYWPYDIEDLRHFCALRDLRIEELKAENAKLRELCVKALEWLRWAGGITCPPEVPDEFADELRELGVEVDG